MENIGIYITFGAIAVACISYITIKSLQICKLSYDERANVLKIYLKGIVAMVEREIGKGNGTEKLQKAKDYFKEKAPLVYKISLSIIGKDNLEDLIEDALSEIKESFKK